MAGGFEPGDENLDWGRNCLRGVGKQRRFVRVDKDAEGNDVNVYELVDDDEWNTIPEQRRIFHLEYHRSIFDPNCPFCHLYRGK